jgi:hypothetical protein
MKVHLVGSLYDVSKSSILAAAESVVGASQPVALAFARSCVVYNSFPLLMLCSCYFFSAAIFCGQSCAVPMCLRFPFRRTQTFTLS